MAEQQSEQWERSEPATPYKLREAREKGMVAKSADVNTVLLITAALVFLLSMGKTFVIGVLATCTAVMRQAGTLEFEAGSLLAHGNIWVSKTLTVLSPLVAVLALTGIAASLVQIGPIFSTQPIKPDFNKLNPVNGFKRLFSMKVLFELAKTLLKFGMAITVLYYAITRMLSELQRMRNISSHAQVDMFLSLSADLITQLLIVLLIAALIDLLFVRWEYGRNLRMTKREMKDEVKRREGDPQIKSKRRELERELRKRSKSLSAVDEADLVITNPTRFAVVLRYDRGSMIAPIVTGKGAGELALAIREKAARRGVPVFQVPPLTRRLFKETGIDKPIPQDCFVAVARVMRQAYAMRSSKLAEAG